MSLKAVWKIQKFLKTEFLTYGSRFNLTILLQSNSSLKISLCKIFHKIKKRGIKKKKKRERGIERGRRREKGGQ